MDEIVLLSELLVNNFLLLPTINNLWEKIIKRLNEVPMPDIARADLISKIREKPQKEPSLGEFESEIRKWIDLYVYLIGNLGTWEDAYARQSGKEFYAGLDAYGCFD